MSCNDTLSQAIPAPNKPSQTMSRGGIRCGLLSFSGALVGCMRSRLSASVCQIDFPESHTQHCNSDPIIHRAAFLPTHHEFRYEDIAHHATKRKNLALNLSFSKIRSDNFVMAEPPGKSAKEGKVAAECGVSHEQTKQKSPHDTHHKHHRITCPPLPLFCCKSSPWVRSGALDSIGALLNNTRTSQKHSRHA